jgi:hypothetical protein
MHVRFQVLMAASMKFRVFWDVLPCIQIDVERRASETSVDIYLTTRQYIQKTLNFKNMHYFNDTPSNIHYIAFNEFCLIVSCKTIHKFRLSGAGRAKIVQRVLVA